MKKYLKQVLLLLLLALCIISLKENKAYASFDWNDIVMFNYMLNQDENTPTNIKAVTNLLINHYQELLDFQENNNYQMNYDMYLVCGMNYGNNNPPLNTIRIYCITKQETTTWNNYNTNIPIRNANKVYYYQYIDAQYVRNWTFGQVRNPNSSWADGWNVLNWSKTYGLINNDLIYQYDQTKYLENYYNAFYLLGAEDRSTLNLPWNFANARIGMNYYNENQKFYIATSTGTKIKEIKAINETISNDGYNYNLLIENTTGLTNGEYHKIIYNNGTNDFYTSPQFIISWSRDTTNDGNIYNSSGEQNGYIDLYNTNILIKGIQNKLDYQTQAIYSGDWKILEQLKEQESGEKARFNFWKNVYNGLFTMSSGDIQYLKTKMEDKLQLQNYANIEEEESILNAINNFSEIGDFKISWQPLVYNGTTLIPSGDINFTQMANRNETYRRVHTLINIICTGALVIILYKSAHNCLMIMLGVGTQIYEQAEEENEIIENTSYDTTVNSDMSWTTRKIKTIKLPNGTKKVIRGKPINIRRE